MCTYLSKDFEKMLDWEAKKLMQFKNAHPSMVIDLVLENKESFNFLEVSFERGSLSDSRDQKT